MGSQRMAIESGKVVRRRRRSDASPGVTDDYDVAFSIDRQIEPASGSGLVINSFDPRKLLGELHHGFGCRSAVTIDAHEAPERAMMRYEIVGAWTDHRGRAFPE